MRRNGSRLKRKSVQPGEWFSRKTSRKLLMNWTRVSLSRRIASLFMVNMVERVGRHVWPSTASNSGTSFLSNKKTFHCTAYLARSGFFYLYLHHASWLTWLGSIYMNCMTIWIHMSSEYNCIWSILQTKHLLYLGDKDGIRWSMWKRIECCWMSYASCCELVVHTLLLL